MLTIDGYAPPDSWTMTLSARSDISSLRASFAGDEAINFEALRTPVVRFDDQPFPWAGGRFRLGPVDTDVQRSMQHPRGEAFSYDATFFAGLDDPVGLYQALVDNLPAAIAARIVYPGYTGNPFALSAYGWWSRLLMSQEDLGAAAAEAWIRSGADLSQKMVEAIAELQEWDEAARILFQEFQSLVPEGDWRRLVCCLDEPPGPTVIPRNLRFTYTTDYTALSRSELHIGVRYLVDPATVPSNVGVDGEQLFVPFDSDTSRALRVSRGLQPDLQSAVVEAELQEWRLLAPNHLADLTVPMPLTLPELTGLLPGAAVSVDDISYWITDLLLESEQDTAVLGVYRAGPHLGGSHLGGS